MLVSSTSSAAVTTIGVVDIFDTPFTTSTNGTRRAGASPEVGVSTMFPAAVWNPGGTDAPSTERVTFTDALPPAGTDTVPDEKLAVALPEASLLNSEASE